MLTLGDGCVGTFPNIGSAIPNIDVIFGIVFQILA